MAKTLLEVNDKKYSGMPVGCDTERHLNFTNNIQLQNEVFTNSPCQTNRQMYYWCVKKQKQNTHILSTTKLWKINMQIYRFIRWIKVFLR